jgi:hypothetical protein
MVVRTAWAKQRDEPEYHLVEFHTSPNIHEETAACGKTARFYPRIGIRIGDSYCSACGEISWRREKDEHG